MLAVDNEAQRQVQQAYIEGEGAVRARAAVAEDMDMDMEGRLPW